MTICGATRSEIVLDFDATDEPLHGSQEGAYFNGYYRGTAICRFAVFAVTFHYLPSCGIANVTQAMGAAAGAFQLGAQTAR